VVKNQGAPGVDGLTVAEFKPWLQAHWPRVRQALLAGQYMPAAVRQVEIPKPQGGVREVLVRSHGIGFAAGYTAALLVCFMNRRMRNRTSGGVGGRRE